VLKEEAEQGFALLGTLSNAQLQEALIDTTAPNEIITFVSRKAIIEQPSGIRYGSLTPHSNSNYCTISACMYTATPNFLQMPCLKTFRRQAGTPALCLGRRYKAQIGKGALHRIKAPRSLSSTTMRRMEPIMCTR
jgi:hypothetical protein